ncbi:hypothetical protein C1645_839841 [Glomus cerebriforme]|uniref:Uncharacterized protein n=1 Tax=Glomus cerebriforme TaxID=658196 RepID=A0A397SBT4_9GLOM|nr:hypothetical protein C1645_839841 [Glomus cerebriforme]
MYYNKQSGNDPVEVRYKTEVEEILNGNHPSLTPKVLNCSLNLGDLDNEEEAAPFDEITEEKPRKAHRSEVRRVKFARRTNISKNGRLKKDRKKTKGRTKAKGI